jgi:hypothetical protein
MTAQELFCFGRLNDGGVTVIVCKFSMWRKAPKCLASQGVPDVGRERSDTQEAPSRVRASARPGPAMTAAWVLWLRGAISECAAARVVTGDTVSAVPKRVATFSNATTPSQHLVVGSSVANQTCWTKLDD